MRLPAFSAILLAAVAPAQSRSLPGLQPVELGTVSWYRDFDAATADARRLDRPLLVLFQEVPGWSTCKTYGAHVLSHPTIVEAAETLFVPACVYNNTKDDDDADVRVAFEEPSWNNPVVRIVSADREDIVPRITDRWTLDALASGMVGALGDGAPGWLRLFADEQRMRAGQVDTAIFAMGWFWVGEAEFGLLDGVVATRAGFLGGNEVVEVRFDPKTLSFDDLLAHAAANDCARTVYATSEAQLAAARMVVGDHARKPPGAIRADGEPKYYLFKSPLRSIPMTELQAIRVNARIQGGTAEALLSPRQKALLATIRTHPDAPWPNVVGAADLEKAWVAVDAVRAALEKSGR